MVNCITSITKGNVFAKLGKRRYFVSVQYYNGFIGLQPWLVISCRGVNEANSYENPWPQSNNELEKTQL